MQVIAEDTISSLSTAELVIILLLWAFMYSYKVGRSKTVYKNSVTAPKNFRGREDAHRDGEIELAVFDEPNYDLRSTI
jgi:hypothetical protein